MSEADYLLLAFGGYIAVMSLVRLMHAREIEVLMELRQEAEERQREQQ